jgi:hypothetical protein
MCGSTCGHGMIIQFMSVNMAASKNMSALLGSVTPSTQVLIYYLYSGHVPMESKRY